MAKNDKVKKQEPVRYTPAGEAAWVKVHVPDTSYKDCGEFAVDLFLSPKDAKETIAVYDKMVADTEAEEGGKPSQDVQYKLVKDCTKKYLDKLSSTGLDPDPTWYLLKFRVDHEVNPKNGKPFTNSVLVLDANNKPLEHDPNNEIGNGSTLKVAYQPYGWAVSGKVGCKMRLKGVQVVDHQSYSTSGVSFETEEDIAF